MYCQILGALGCVSTRHPSAPRGPNSVMFIQFSAKILPKNRFLPLFQGLVFPSLENPVSTTDITTGQERLIRTRLIRSSTNLK